MDDCLSAVYAVRHTILLIAVLDDDLSVVEKSDCIIIVQAKGGTSASLVIWNLARNGGEIEWQPAPFYISRTALRL